MHTFELDPHNFGKHTLIMTFLISIMTTIRFVIYVLNQDSV